MASRFVKSPAGERIEIVSDDDWMALTETDEYSLRSWNQGKKRFIIRELWERGTVTNKSGRASKELFDSMVENFPDMEHTGFQSMSTLMAHPVNAPAFKRSTNGKRTHEITLIALPETWYRKLMDDINHDAYFANGPTETIDEPVPELVDEMPVDQGDQEAAELVAAQILPPEPVDRTTDDFDDSPLTAPTLELEVASQVAMALLTQVVEIISTGSPEATDMRIRKLEADYADVSHKLSLRLNENDVLRRQIREVQDTNQAIRHERDGLRGRVRSLEANLQAALKGDAAAAVNGLVQKKIDEIMRAQPTPKGSDETPTR
jgi:hypothetical protein